MTRSASPRLRAYAALAGLGLVAGLASGRIELVVLATPFALAAAAALVLATKPQLVARVSLPRDRALEGDELTASVELLSATGIDRLELLVRLPNELELGDRGASPRAVRLHPGRTRTLELPLRCTRWGAFAVGPVIVRARDPLACFAWEGRVGEAAPLRVYPEVEPLRALLKPLETQVFVGNQVSRTRGDGIEFADIRPFVPGDRVRRVNWRASARRGSLLVNDFHPERNADIILFLDTFADVRRGASGTIDLAVRAAASLAARYLRRKDRVGLVSFGGFLSWLMPELGTVQLYRILDSLLQTEIVLSFAARGVDVLPPRTLPPKALVIALTPLLDPRSAGSLLDLRARGFDLTVIEISPLPFVDPGRSSTAKLAFRLWRLARESLRARYEASGIPVIEWREDLPLDAALEEVASFRRRARALRG